ncbi:DUF202 domain-containing protein [Sodalis sp. dw_96]|uniref:DUF202 domain-containing protein n=1 Tax=Sodalis sp. dw_96 TaxID=2719794 RepID=UPI001BD55B05|nr:DUF202 domain-containing protein [Sodalis sp. dw_96]
MARGTAGGPEDQNIPGQNNDPGLQPERTRQAWDRTLLVIMLDAVFFLRIGLINSNIFTCLAGGLLLLLTLGIVLTRHFSPAYGKNGLKIISPHILSAVSLTVIIACALTCISIVVADIRVFAR